MIESFILYIIKLIAMVIAVIIAVVMNEREK